MAGALPIEADVRPGPSFWRCIVPCLALASLATAGAIADESKKESLSALAQNVLTWLPEDTESVVVRQSFALPTSLVEAVEGKPPADSAPTEVLFLDSMSARALGALFDVRFLRLLAGKKIELALRGSRNYDWVSASLPTHRSENCSIIVFEENLGPAGPELQNVFHREAIEKREIAGREMFVFPVVRNMRPERTTKSRGAPGIYLVMLDPKTLLCATSDTYLEDLLQRVDARPQRLAVPERAPIWRQIDPQAPAWMLWHVPAATIEKFGGEPLVDGIACTVSQDRFRAVYLPNQIDPERVERVARRTWQPEGMDVHPAIEKRQDGAIVISSSTKRLNFDAKFWFSLALYHLEAGNGADGDN